MVSIPATYYDTQTQNLLSAKLTVDDNLFIKENNLKLDDVLFNRWQIIICSLMIEHYNEYLSMDTIEDRNKWFQTYLNLDTYDMELMPKSLKSF
jgi:hypothetical protein